MLENLVFGSPIEGTPPSPDHIRAVLHDYCKFLSEGDVDGILNLFDPEARFFDPVGEPPRIGHDQIREFFEPSAGQLVLRPEGAIRVAGFYAAVGMRARVHGYGPEFFVDTLDAVVFNEAGRMTHFYAFWGSSNNPSPDTNWPPHQGWDNT